jgi:hypothetical protein
VQVPPQTGTQIGLAAFDEEHALLLAHLHELIVVFMGARERFAFGVALALAGYRKTLRHQGQPSQNRFLPSAGPATSGHSAAGRFEQHKQALPALDQLGKALFAAGDAFGSLMLENIEVVFGDVDSDKARVYNYSACRCAARSVAPASINCSG